MKEMYSWSYSFLDKIRLTSAASKGKTLQTSFCIKFFCEFYSEYFLLNVFSSRCILMSWRASLSSKGSKIGWTHLSCIGGRTQAMRRRTKAGWLESLRCVRGKKKLTYMWRNLKEIKYLRSCVGRQLADGHRLFLDSAQFFCNWHLSDIFFSTR